MQKRLSATATTVGVNGDYFNVNDGRPSGVLVRNGVLEHPPRARPHERRHRRRRHAARRPRDDARLLARHRAAAPRRAERSAERERLRAVHARVRCDDAARRQRGGDRLPAVPDGHAEHRPRGGRDERRRAEHRQDVDTRRRSRAAGDAGRTRSVSSARRRSAARSRRASRSIPRGTGSSSAIGGGPAIVADGKADLPRRRGVHARRSSRRTTRARPSASARTARSCSSPSTEASPATASG